MSKPIRLPFDPVVHCAVVIHSKTSSNTFMHKPSKVFRGKIFRQRRGRLFLGFQQQVCPSICGFPTIVHICPQWIRVGQSKRPLRWTVPEKKQFKGNVNRVNHDITSVIRYATPWLGFSQSLQYLSC